MTGWRAAVLVAAVLAVLAGSARGACPGDETHFRLYRSSAATQGAAIHVATFDATLQAEGGGAAEYNRGNCEIARNLFQSQPGVIVTYWCERWLADR
jgi:hypothetical protein